MGMMIFNVVLSATLIAFCSWLARTNTQLAGFIIALPISTMIALALTHSEFKDAGTSIALAKSIFAAIPLSLLFFVPFLLADKTGWPFWVQYGSGVALLGVGYLVHRAWV